MFPPPAQERDLKSSLPAVPLRNLTSIFCLSARKPAPKPHPHSPKSPLIVTQLPEGLLTLQGLRFLTTYLLPKQTVLPLQPSVRSPSTPALQVPRNLSSTVTAITVTDSHLMLSGDAAAPPPQPLTPLPTAPDCSLGTLLLLLLLSPSPGSLLRTLPSLPTEGCGPPQRCRPPVSSRLLPNPALLRSILLFSY